MMHIVSAGRFKKRYIQQDIKKKNNIRAYQRHKAMSSFIDATHILQCYLYYWFLWGAREGEEKMEIFQKVYVLLH